MFAMRNRKLNLLIVLALVATLTSVSKAVAQEANESFSQAVCTFNAGSYPQAADMFAKFLQSAPQDQLAHYYLGVCLHCLGRAPEAAAEYGWVNSNSKDPELLKRAQMGLQVLSRAMPQAAADPTQQMQQMPAQQPGAAPTGWLSPTGVRKAMAADGGISRQPVAGQPTVIDLYTSWCGWCKVFEPIFMQAQAKYGTQIGFQRLNAEVESNKYLVKKYRVRGYPTVLFLDGSGKLIERIDGAPRTLAEFEQTLFQAYPAVKPF